MEESIYTGLFAILSPLGYLEKKSHKRFESFKKIIVNLEIARDYFEGMTMQNSLVYKTAARFKLCFWQMESIKVTCTGSFKLLEAFSLALFPNSLSL